MWGSTECPPPSRPSTEARFRPSGRRGAATALGLAERRHGLKVVNAVGALPARTTRVPQVRPRCPGRSRGCVNGASRWLGSYTTVSRRGVLEAVLHCYATANTKRGRTGSWRAVGSSVASSGMSHTHSHLLSWPMKRVANGADATLVTNYAPGLRMMEGWHERPAQNMLDNRLRQTTPGTRMVSRSLRTLATTRRSVRRGHIPWRGSTIFPGNCSPLR